MAPIPASILRNYLLGAHISRAGCLVRHRIARTCRPSVAAKTTVRSIHATINPTDASALIPPPLSPRQSKLQDKASRKRNKKAEPAGKETLAKWELTVGIEIHAQLNTPRKLFSSAAASIDDAPNTHVALFDIAMPGSQPAFQKETLIPAIRASLALNCRVNQTSKFDRKHYFHWDQPAGYQITQYYEALANDGFVTLYKHDGIAPEDGDEVKIGIKQVQMEQDTAKTKTQIGNEHHLDFNRAGLPLIEIITLPHIHHPKTAAALVKKIQILLNCVDACVLGMESGGLRADVNVSVRQRDGKPEDNEYGGVTGLGQRTEIKNLSSFKAIEDAIIAERDRQIAVLEAGGVIEGETRGWTIGGRETIRLRGKEGEVDYRYMPDPDIHPIIIRPDLIERLKNTLGVLPDEEISNLVDHYGLTTKDAMSLAAMNDGGRMEYFWRVYDECLLSADSEHDVAKKELGQTVGNWVLHRLGGLVSDFAEDENALRLSRDGSGCIIPPKQLAALITNLNADKILAHTAEKVLRRLFDGAQNGMSEDVEAIIEAEGWWFQPLTAAEYEKLAQSVWDQKIADDVLAGNKGKLNVLIGRMIKKDQEGRVRPKEAAEVLTRMLGEYKPSS